MKVKKILSIIGLGSFLMLSTGCATDNPFGIGFEHSACEGSSKFGVCGAPIDVLKYEAKIKRTQGNYLKSGLNQRLFFAITHDGRILVKAKREGPWQDYNHSKWKKIIDSRLYNRTQAMSSTNQAITIGGVNISSLNGIKVNGRQNDLSVIYKKQGTLIETRTNVGNMIRDNGWIQRIWIAPYVDQKGDLVSAHEIYVVIKKPHWIVGNSYPIYQGNIGHIPTPLSVNVLKRQERVETKQENIIQDYNMNNLKSIKKNIKKETNEDQIINSFIKNKTN